MNIRSPVFGEIFSKGSVACAMIYLCGVSAPEMCAASCSHISRILRISRSIGGRFKDGDVFVAFAATCRWQLYDHYSLNYMHAHEHICHLPYVQRACVNIISSTKYVHTHQKHKSIIVLRKQITCALGMCNILGIFRHSVYLSVV